MTRKQRKKELQGKWMSLGVSRRELTPGFIDYVCTTCNRILGEKPIEVCPYCEKARANKTARAQQFFETMKSQRVNAQLDETKVPNRRTHDA